MPTPVGMGHSPGHKTRSPLLLPVSLCVVALCLAATLQSPEVWAQSGVHSDLTQVSLEDLMNIEVTSASKKEQRISRVPAAIFVITQEDIRHSGATNIPDLLRMVPGLQVAQINSSTWAITARGFNGQFANRLLVMIDGRTFYDPSNSGVYWDVQDTVLEDIERIEVIRGPGATIWGTNAVNGVINIITENSEATQGGLLTGGAGSYEQQGTLRYGGTLGKSGHYRVFGKYFNRGSFDDLSGTDQADAWHSKQAGFRTDLKISEHDSLTVQGDLYGGSRGAPYGPGAILTPPFSSPPLTEIQDTSGGNVLARWDHVFRGGSELSLQTYFDRLTRVDPVDPELRTTYDLDFRHHLSLGRRHDVVWGFGYRTNWDRLSGSSTVSFNPPVFKSSISNTFVQDEISIVNDKLWLTVGAKVEHNAFSGFEAQPNVRLLWTPQKRHTLWAAYSNAIRIPARNDRHLRVNLSAIPGEGGSVMLLSLLGNPNYLSEDLDAYELGYRFQATKRLSLDFASFYNDYDHIRSTESGTPFFEASPPPPHLVLPLVFDNRMFGVTYGAEAYVEWRATKFWLLKGGYSWLVPSLRLEPLSTDSTSIQAVEGENPRNQFEVRSQFDLTHRFEFDSTLYHVGRLATGDILSYTRVDARFAWHVGERMAVSVAAQNLLDPRHPEFSGSAQSFTTTQPKRGVYGSLTWRF